jgi:predicted protein tyrosine phosphatase
MRSRTAEEIYKHDDRFVVKSAGVSDDADVRVSLAMMEWADYIVVMEEMHLEWLRTSFPGEYLQKESNIFCLGIPDEFWFMDQELVSLIKVRFESIYQREITLPGMDAEPFTPPG